MSTFKICMNNGDLIIIPDTDKDFIMANILNNSLIFTKAIVRPRIDGKYQEDMEEAKEIAIHPGFISYFYEDEE